MATISRDDFKEVEDAASEIKWTKTSLKSAVLALPPAVYKNEDTCAFLKHKGDYKNVICAINTWAKRGIQAEDFDEDIFDLQEVDFFCIFVHIEPNFISATFRAHSFSSNENYNQLLSIPMEANPIDRPNDYVGLFLYKKEVKNIMEEQLKRLDTINASMVYLTFL